MSISAYLKEIGRGATGARALAREQAADLFGQVLDGSCTELEIGAFCIAMRIKGETPEEMAGFLDAVHARAQRPVATAQHPVVVLPSYNGARKLPVLTPLLALLLARKGLPVLVHGTATEDARIATRDVLAAIGLHEQPAVAPLAAGAVHFVGTESLLPGLARLLHARRTIGLRNPAHSLVKLWNPVQGPALVVGSYTHPEYASAMAATFQLTATPALLLRGTEGEPVADPRRTPRMDVFLNGSAQCVQAAQQGPLATLPTLPLQIDAATTAKYTLAVLRGLIPAPTSLLTQIEHIVRACKAIAARDDPSNLARLGDE
ncbi:MAG: DNA-binding protein YbiB [Pseudomonadota bacterium]|nr:DNA-binding protein YbiB [Pseudomonadota bacterium]